MSGMRRREHGAIAGHSAACRVVQFRGCHGMVIEDGEFLPHRVFEPPLAEGALIEVQPVLLWANHHSRSHEAHEGDALVGREAVAVDEVRSNQTSRATESRFTMDGNAFPFGDGLRREANEFAHKCLKQGRCRHRRSCRDA